MAKRVQIEHVTSYFDASTLLGLLFSVIGARKDVRFGWFPSFSSTTTATSTASTAAKVDTAVQVVVIVIIVDICVRIKISVILTAVTFTAQ